MTQINVNNLVRVLRVRLFGYFHKLPHVSLIEKVVKIGGKDAPDTPDCFMEVMAAIRRPASCWNKERSQA